MPDTVYRGRLPEGGCVAVTVDPDAGTIASVSPVPDDDSLPYLLPVLVDLQQNGSLGLDYNRYAEETLPQFDKGVRYLRMHGVGRILITVTTYYYDRIKRSVGLLHDYMRKRPDLAGISLGFFHEGVFISPQDGWRGAHPLQHIHAPDYDMFKELDDCAGGTVRMVNVAPEEPGGLDFVERAVADGKLVALGHACPDPETTAEAVARGATMITHFANGAAPLVKRFANPFWAWMHHKELKLGLICDGFHLPPELVGAAMQCKDPENCWVVSDASGFSGCKPGQYDVPGKISLVIEESRHMHMTESRDLLAGNWFQQDRGVDFLVRRLGWSFTDAWRQCSVVPARLVGATLPQLREGEEASFVAARWEDGVRIEHSVHNGRDYIEDGPVRPETTAPEEDFAIAQ